MDAASLVALARDLLAVIHSLSGYPANVLPPEIHFVPVTEIQRRFCNAPCRMQAYYLPGEGVYMDATLDPERDVFARSILLHELVHHLQKVSGKYMKIPSECDRWYAAELEAYETQNRYLESVNSPHRVYINTWQLMCGN
jgi:hypothetical protein